MMSYTRVIDPITVMCLNPVSLTTKDAYDATTTVIMDVCGMKGKTILVKNIDVANSLTWKISGSIDNGHEYDYAVKTEAVVASAAKESTVISDYYTHLKLEFKSTVGAAPARFVVKAAAIGI